MRLLLARHGESTWNAEGRYQGRLDAPLSALGLEQARALAAHCVRDERDRPHAIVSSPLRRARDTALAVSSALGIDLTTDERLLEISHGAWEGLLKSQIAQRWPEMYAAWQDAPETVTFPGGESLEDVRRRWNSFTADSQFHGSPVLVVTHDVIVRIAVLEARGLSLRDFSTFTAENAALTRLERADGRSSVIGVNENSYLGNLRVDPGGQAL